MPEVRPAESQAAEGTWFPFTPASDTGPSAIGMEDWLEKPAGKRGGVRIDGGGLALEDGTPIKFWGVNICNMRCAPAREEAEQWAALLAKYGVNAVRHHKFIRDVGDKNHSDRFDPELFARHDYFNAELKNRGIYFAWSAIYGLQVRPGDREKLLAYDEVANVHGSHLKGTSYGLINFAPDLQDLAIDLTVAMLQHRNPHTGLTYAEDPALAFVEFQNEDDIFFPTTMNAVEACPTYKKLFCEQFSDWLRAKYGSHEKLAEAWGRGLGAYPEYMADEHLDKRNIYPIAHYWWYGHEGLAKQEKEKGAGKRLLDTARFLYETQNHFYARFEKAIRDAGYQGPLVGSCWQAGDGMSHYYNLHSDAIVGIVDRHNYFAGQGGHQMKIGPLNNRSMMSRPGSGLLSTGMQSVKDRPFQLSEWMGLIPNEWVAEGPAIVGAYGMGLQGWDGSFSFASDFPHLTPTIQTRTVYNAMSPTQIGLYPAISRMVLRSDVQEGKPLPTRKVHVPSLSEGQVGIQEQVEQQGDLKSFTGSVPAEALAVGKVDVEFVETPQETEPTDLNPALAERVLQSNTGQLVWDYSQADKGCFTVDTPGTKAVVGFVPDRPLQLDGVTFRIENPFAIVFLTGRGQRETIANAKSLLLTVLARARNTGMRYNADGTELLEMGAEPIQLEAVRATVELPRKGAVVHVLDADGRRTGNSIPADDGVIHIDGARDKTMYYEIVLE